MVGRRGFTLVEVVLSVGVAAVLIGGLMYFYVGVRRAEFHGSQALDSLDQAQALMGWLVEDLHAMAPSGAGPAEWFRKSDADGDSLPEYRFERWGALDASGAGARVAVEYRVAPGPTVVRRATDRPGQEQQLVRSGLRSFSAELLWTYRRGQGASETLVLASSTPPGAGDALELAFVHVEAVLQQESRAGVPTTTLPVSVDVYPRELNAYARRHWIASAPGEAW